METPEETDPLYVIYLKGYVSALTHTIILIQHLSGKGMSTQQITLELMGLLNEELNPKLDALLKKVSGK